MIKLNIMLRCWPAAANSYGSLAEEKLDKPQAPKREKTIIELWVLFIGIWSCFDMGSKQPVNLAENSKEPSCVKSSQEPLGMSKFLPLFLADLA